MTASADYGFDAPRVPLLLGVGGLLLLAFGIVLASGAGLGSSAGLIVGGTVLLLSAASFVYTTRRGKRIVWRELIDELELEGDEDVLDMGCGRGLVLLLAAGRLPEGHAVGLDRWRTVDQTGNTVDAARSNAGFEGVGERVELVTGDMTSMPFPGECFDLVLSALAIHNIGDERGQRAEVAEALRVLRPGGRVLIADFRSTKKYRAWLEAELPGVSVRRLGYRYWYGGPWAATSLISATRPGG